MIYSFCIGESPIIPGVLRDFDNCHLTTSLKARLLLGHTKSIPSGMLYGGFGAVAICRAYVPELI